jgi:multiple sugar transport system substrate-binding protein
MNRIITKVLATSILAIVASGAMAQETVVWWDFLTGGDGIRMKKLIEDFNAEHQGAIEIQATTLEWGVPFYTKVQTSAAIGEGPDVMTYHQSRLPISVDNGSLSEITDADLAAMGLSAADYPADTWDAAHVDGKLYAIPFDLHPVVLYYNKDILAANGLLGDDGLPTGLEGVDNLKAALKKIQDGGTTWGMANFTSNGDFAQRYFYSFLKQQDGELMTDGEFLAGDNLDKMVNAVQLFADLIAEGYMPGNTEYPAALALFTTGEAAFHINGVWEVPSMTDLAAQGKLGFEWGAVEIPAFFGKTGTYADSHAFSIPNNVGNPATPEKHAAVLEVISWMAKHSLYWATAGHIPAYKPVTDSADYQAMEPNATYSVLTARVIYDAPTKFAGVASPVSEAAGNYFAPAMNGEMDVREAVETFRDDVNALLE